MGKCELRQPRHCERNEAIHLLKQQEWIASSHVLLAMTSRKAHGK